jgi:hypothetical protein
MIPSTTLGQFNISGAVIGEQFRPTGSILFDEEWMTSPKGDNGWYMSHDDSSSMADTTFCNTFYCPDDNHSCSSSCPSTCIDGAGKATDSVDTANEGILTMNNIRYAFPGCDPSSNNSPGHCNVSLIGYNAYDGYNYTGDTYNKWDSGKNKYIFPIDITKDTYIQISVDEMSIDPIPTKLYYQQAYQVVELYFNHGYVLQLFMGDQGILNNNPYVGYFGLDLGLINVDNIYELFERANLPTPPQDLKLNYIQIGQQTLWNLPCNIEYTQKMKIDLIRIGEIVGPSSP